MAGVVVDRYSFNVWDLHPLLQADLNRRFPTNEHE